MSFLRAPLLALCWLILATPHARAEGAESQRSRTQTAPRTTAPARAQATTTRTQAAPAPARAQTATTRAQAAPRTQTAQASRTTKAPTKARTRRRPSPPPCNSPAVTFTRLDGGKRESRTFSLTRCDGTPIAEALDSLSILARPHGVSAPTVAQVRDYARRANAPEPRRRRRGPQPPPRPDAAFVVERIKRLDRGLIARMQRIAKEFSGRTIEIVSGYRPDERSSSRHHHARAMDVRVVGISRERLRDFARTFDETGVGYYPNSVFVHVDVRDRRAYWVDRSTPGNEADYGTWPPTQQDVDRAREAVLTRTNDALQELAEVTAAEQEQAHAAD